MDPIELNKVAWSQVSAEHYRVFKERFRNNQQHLNPYISKEVGDLSGKNVIHLQCNTGADTILLAKMAKHATGVDLVPDNIHYAKKLSSELQIDNINFLEYDIMTLMDHHHDKYDVVFISEGAIGWLPDLKRWGKTIRSLLKDDGYLYVFDAHPLFLTFDEEKLAHEEFDIKYPYFSKVPDVDNSIGGYASEAKTGYDNYFWMYTVGEIINSLTEAGLHINYFHEFKENFFDSGGMTEIEKSGLFNLNFNDNKFPMSFSIKAIVYDK